MRPTLNIFLPIDDKSPVLLVHQCPLIELGKFLGSVAFGQMERVDQVEFERNAQTLIQKSLDQYLHRSCAQKGEFDLLPPKEQRAIDKAYLDVLCSLRENGEIWVDTPNSGRRVVLSAEESSLSIMEKLRLLMPNA